uniref:Uncharacterized protein n=1 Tax=Bos mutus grunniens TaxID=30521 RepID=A0A8B9WHQ8_BOSMU
MRPIQKRQLLGIMELEEPEKVEVLQPEEHFEQFLFPVISEVQEAIVPRTGVHRKAYDIIGSGCRKWAINSSNKTQVESLGKSTLNYFQNQWSQGQRSVNMVDLAKTDESEKGPKKEICILLKI